MNTQDEHNRQLINRIEARVTEYKQILEQID